MVSIIAVVTVYFLGMFYIILAGVKLGVQNSITDIPKVIDSRWGFVMPLLVPQVMCPLIIVSYPNKFMILALGLLSISLILSSSKKVVPSYVEILVAFSIALFSLVWEYHLYYLAGWVLLSSVVIYFIPCKNKFWWIEMVMFTGICAGIGLGLFI